MGAFALVLGLLGWVCAILGIVTATGALPPVHDAFTWELWFWLAAILLLTTIACALGRGGTYE